MANYSTGDGDTVKRYVHDTSSGNIIYMTYQSAIFLIGAIGNTMVSTGCLLIFYVGKAEM